MPPSISGGNWTESILWSFGNGKDGQNPTARLIMDASGNLHGTTYFGGRYGYGIVFNLTAQGDESVLWSFGKDNDGAEPSELITDTSGKFYGTTETGGTYNNSGSGGTVFELSNLGNPPMLTASPAKLNFGRVDATLSSKAKELTFNNEAAATAQISQIVPPAWFIISDDTCSNTSLAVEPKCSIDIAYAPATPGSSNGSLTIPYNGRVLV